MADADPPAKKDKKDEETRLLRDVLDWMPSDVLRSEAKDEEEYEILASIDARLDRTIVEHGGEEPEDADEELPEPEEPLEAGDQEPPAPPVSDDPEGTRHPTVTTVRLEGTEDDEQAPAEEEPGTVEVVVAEEGDEQAPEPDEPAREPGRVEVVVAEEPGTPEPDQGTLADDALVQERQQAGWPGPVNGGGEPGPWDDLTGFTVVAPPTGGIEGDWIVPGEEQISHGELDQLSADLDTDLAMPGMEEQWPEAEELEEELDADLDEDLEEPAWPEEDEDLLEEELLADEELAEAEPEQDELEDEEDVWADEEEDDEFWENLLEEPEDEVPEFESEEDWDTEGAEATEEPVEAEEEDPFADLWEPGEEREAVAAEPAAEEPEVTWEPATAEAEAAEEDELEFEEVEFTLAEPEPEPEAIEAEAIEEEDRGIETTEEAGVAWPQEEAAEEPQAEPFEEELWEEEEAGPDEVEEAPEETAVEEDAPELDEEPSEASEAYTHGPYTLYHKVVETGDGDTRDLYFFARTAPEDARPSDLPDGYEVGVNERTGVPFVRQQRD